MTGLPSSARQGFGVLGKLRARCLPVTLPLSTGWIGRPWYSSTPPRSFTHSMRVRGRPRSTSIDGVRVGIGAGGVIDRQRRLVRIRDGDLAQRHAQVGRGLRHGIDFPRGGQRAGGDLRRLEFGGGDRFVHGLVSFERLFSGHSRRSRARRRPGTRCRLRCRGNCGWPRLSCPSRRRAAGRRCGRRR